MSGRSSGMRIILVMFASALSLLGDEPPKKFDKLQTLNGKVYEKVEVRKIEPDGISIIHDAGTAKVMFENLPKALQDAYQFDPGKAAEHREQTARLEAEEHTSQWEKLPAQQRFLVYPTSGIGCAITYKDRISLIEKAEQSARVEMLGEARLKSRLSTIPKGGEIWFTINRSTIGAANTEYFVAIVTDQSGKEIARGGGQNSIAEVPGSDEMWWNMFHVEVPVEFEAFVRVRLVDRLENKSAEFIIRKNFPE